MIKVNGQKRDVSGKTISELLILENYQPAHVAVERNEEIVPKAEYDQTEIQDGDVIEIVRFVGGG